MKMNCIIQTAQDLAELATTHLASEGENIHYKADSCYLNSNGDLIMTIWNNKTKFFDGKRTFTGNELAYMLNMPLWELIGIDNGGADDFALLFYEETNRGA